jgi:tripeptidyl-peptidase I
MVASAALVLAFVALASAKPTTSPLVRHESREDAPAGWVNTGAADATTEINMRVGLPSKDFAGLEKVLYDVSTPSSANYGKHINVDQVRTA